MSWWLQAELLIGKNGLVPIHQLLEFLDQRWQETDTGSRWNLPSLFWLTGGSDLAIHLVFAIGVALAVLIILGLIQGPALIGVWGIYLSFVSTGDTFMSFQWDILLLEAGFLAVLVSSWKIREKFRQPPNLNLRRWIAIGFVWLLIAKLMFLSGWVKLAWASEQHPEWWPEHTAMLFHYQTQPIPSWTAWFTHQLPAWFHRMSIWPMYFIELILPFFILLGNRLRAFAGVGFIVLMVLILLTGNYTFFNWLTIALCLPLIPDHFWRPRRLFALSETEHESIAWQKWTGLGLATPVFLLLLLLNWQALTSSLHNAPTPLLKVSLSPKPLTDLARRISPFHICSSYGLFRTMTIDRPEIILEGSSNGLTWVAYDFKWKPDRLDERPRFIAPHQPRVAWQLWFAALERQYHPQSRNSRWIQALLVKLLKGEENVQQLFTENPFPDNPPKLLRARLYLYEFTDSAEKRQTGNWWKRSEAGSYLPEIRAN